MSSLLMIIPSLVQSVDPNMILTSILEIRNNNMHMGGERQCES